MIKPKNQTICQKMHEFLSSSKQQQAVKILPYLPKSSLANFSNFFIFSGFIAVRKIKFLDVLFLFLRIHWIRGYSCVHVDTVDRTVQSNSQFLLTSISLRQRIRTIHIETRTIKNENAC